jgi:glutathione synthase/RimK-type ligase-like ATP-grasp enzyme
MSGLSGPARQRRGGADDGAQRRVLALVTSEELPELDPDSQLLPAALEAAGLDVRLPVWSDPDVDWTAFDVVVVRSTWDYFDRPAEFRAWVERVAPTVPFFNPADVVLWNAHKGYLRDLGERGVPVVDTVWVAAGEQIAAPFAEAVVKPAVSGGSQGLYRVRGGATVTAEEDTLVQPLLASIADEGELSLLYAGGELSHTVRKVPARGDIRSQPEFGSDVRLEDAPGEAVEVARTVLDAVGHELPYARVDLVRAGDGTLRLIELEVIEPQLYLRWDPGSPARFASALAGVARSS